MLSREFIVKDTESVVGLLEKMSQQLIQTVFVIDSNEKVIGVITDGDIRRGLLKNLTINDSITNFMFQDFHFLQEGDDFFKKLKQYRKKEIKIVPLLSKDKTLIKIYNFNEIKSLLPIDAIIMAGGKGTRLRPLTEKVPKPLLKVKEKEIISYNFDRLYKYGIINQNITVNYLGDQIESFCKNYNKDINFNIVKETEFLGTAGSISLIKEFKNDVILLMNSDLLTNIDYEDFYLSFVAERADIMVASVPYDVNLPYAIFNASDRKIKSFTEKPTYTYYANAGIYLIKKELLKEIPQNEFYNATDLMNAILEKNGRLLHYPIRGYWLDIGKHNDFEKAQRDVAHIDFD